MMAKLIVLLIRIYQRYFPVKYKRSCLYHPSCSEYAVMAIEKYGLVRGIGKSWGRFRRCKPPVHNWEDYP